jgi:hypothetical protein
MDRLTIRQQEEWAREKRAYTNDILKSQLAVQQAREAYNRVLAEQRYYQMSKREALYGKLRAWGVKMEDVVSRPIQPEEQLEAELESLGFVQGQDFLFSPVPDDTESGDLNI